MAGNFEGYKFVDFGCCSMLLFGYRPSVIFKAGSAVTYFKRFKLKQTGAWAR